MGELMRRAVYYIVTICLLLCHTAAAAPAEKKSEKKKTAREWVGANRNVHHIGFWGGAGYSAMLNGFQNNKFVGGGGGLIGFGYEYRYDHFILDLGPEFRIFSSMDRITFPAPYDVLMMADGYNQIKHYTFSNPMNENHIAGQVMLPVMLGGTWDKFYFMGGAKVGYTLLGTYSQQSRVTTTITDAQAYDPDWGNMPTHNITTDQPYSANGRNNYGLDLAVSAELGLKLNGFMGDEWNAANKERKHPIHMRLAVFADYGVLSLSHPQQGPIAAADEQQIHTRSLHTSDWAKGPLNSLMVGVKFTAMFQMNKPQQPPPQRPALALFVTDCKTELAVNAVNAEFTQTQLNPLAVKKAKGLKKSKSGKKKKPRVIKRVTDREGKAVAKMPSGTYHIQLKHPDYTPLEQEFEHGLWGDTLRLAICERPYFRLYVRDAQSDSLLASYVTFINNSGDSIATLRTDSITGFAQIRLPINKQLRIRIEAEDHFALAEHIEDIGAEITYRLNRIEKEKKIVLHNLFFATNKTTILPTSEPALQDLYEMLTAHPDYRIVVVGHTDNIGSDRSNQRLSEGRAKSVRDDLIRRGIDPERIETEGRGESQPITTNDTDEGRAQNRRVEFILIQQ